MGLISRLLPQESLVSGTLVVPVGPPLPSQDTHYLVYSEDWQANSRLQAFRLWLTDQARRFTQDNKLPLSTP